MALWCQSNKNGMAINNRYLDFAQLRSLILFVNDHVDKDLYTLARL